jgi:hypothetical protein
MTNKRGQVAIFIGVFITLILIIAFILQFAIGIHIKTMDNGHHTGYVTAIETNGMIWKTDSVYFKTDAQSSQEDRYCVIDDDIKQKLLSSQMQKKLVTITYMQYFSAGWNNCKLDDYAGIITGVEG